jgi:hypothetical protein
VAAASNKCVQFIGVPPNPGNGEIRTCNGSKAQEFKLQPLPGGYTTIINAQSNDCLDVVEASSDNGTVVGQYGCHGGPNQQWIVADAGGNTIRLVARHSGKVLDVSEAKTDDGTRLCQWDWKSSSNQQFKLVKVVAPDGGADSGKGSAAGGKNAGKSGKAKKVDKADKPAKPEKPAKPAAPAHP